MQAREISRTQMVTWRGDCLQSGPASGRFNLERIGVKPRDSERETD